MASFRGSEPILACTELSPVKSSGFALTCSLTTSSMRTKMPMSEMMSISICMGRSDQAGVYILTLLPAHALLTALHHLLPTFSMIVLTIWQMHSQRPPSTCTSILAAWLWWSQAPYQTVDESTRARYYSPGLALYDSPFFWERVMLVKRSAESLLLGHRILCPSHRINMVFIKVISSTCTCDLPQPVWKSLELSRFGVKPSAKSEGMQWVQDQEGVSSKGQYNADPRP